jgi:hypothetical protein
MNELIQKLRSFAAGETTPDWEEDGLCFFLEHLSPSGFVRLLRESYQSWPHYSGNHTYPVPSPEEAWTPKAMYWATHNKWEGEYGDLRRDLCRHFADYLENQHDLESLNDLESQHDLENQHDLDYPL